MLRVTTFALAITFTLGFGFAASAEEWGDLTGKFIYDGPAPTPKPLTIDADAAEFGKLGLVDESLLVDKKTGGIANIVVYVRTKDVAIHPDYEKKLQKVVKLDNKGGKFVPHILPLWVEKQTICLCNSDGVSHNSNLQPFGDTGINPLLPAKGEIEHKLNVEQTVPAQVTCNIHRWMAGYVLPRSNPYVAVSAADGSFKLEKLPAGAELEFLAWHEKSGYVATPEWVRGRFKRTLKAGANELGTVKLKPALFEK